MNKYSNEFKEEAVKRVLSGVPASQVAREIGVNVSSLYTWKARYLKHPEQPFVGSGKLRDEDAELRTKAREMFRNKTLSETKQLIDLFVEKVLVYEDEIQVILNLVPFFYRHDFTQEVRRIRRSRLKPCRRTLT